MYCTDIEADGSLPHAVVSVTLPSHVPISFYPGGFPAGDFSLSPDNLLVHV